MIKYVTGDLLDSNAEALVNTVNTVGVMGKGIALQFKKRFPNNNKLYVQACKDGELYVGRLLITTETSLVDGDKLIVNFPTKIDWRNPSEYDYIEKGLQELVREINKRGIRSIAIPPLGSGNGGLDWNVVHKMIVDTLSNLDCEVYVYQPCDAIIETLRKERVKLTPARAMLLSMLYRLVSEGEFVSEFAAEKVAYFLQRFGAKPFFKLEFEPNYYGPYSGKVRHVLEYLNGSYITGYSDKDKKPFEYIWMVMDGRKDVEGYLDKEEHKVYRDIVSKTDSFLTGYYSNFGLELLSSVDYIINTKGYNSVDDIYDTLINWNNRKGKVFDDNSFTKKAKEHIDEYLHLNIEN